MSKDKIEKMKEYLKENLSKKRYNHSVNVSEAAERLAMLYGEDRERAGFAGMVHDIAKELNREEQYELAKRCDIDVSEIELNSAPLLHAVAGAQFLKEKFGVEDKEILRAVRYHTVACADMSRLEQIVYLADLISDDRDFKDVKKMRKFANISLEKGMLEALKFSVEDTAAKGSTIPVCTIEAYNEFVVKMKDKK